MAREEVPFQKSQVIQKGMKEEFLHCLMHPIHSLGLSVSGKSFGLSEGRPGCHPPPEKGGWTPEPHILHLYSKCHTLRQLQYENAGGRPRATIGLSIIGDFPSFQTHMSSGGQNLLAFTS